MESKSRFLLLSLWAIVAGVAQTATIGISVPLQYALGSPLRSGSIHFLVGTTAIAAVWACTLWRKKEDFDWHEVKWWFLLGGPLGVGFTMLGFVITPVIGFTVFFCMAVFGSLVSACVIDYCGGVLGTRWTAFVQITGVLLVAGGSVMTELGQPEKNQPGAAAKGAVAIFFGCVGGFTAGFLKPVQTFVNTKLSKTSKVGPLGSSSISFGLGTGTYIVAALVQTLIMAPTNSPIPFKLYTPIHTWMFLGGFCGATAVLSSVALSPLIGLAALYVCMTLGELLGSTIFDTIGLFGVSPTPPNGWRIFGLFIVFIGALMFRGEALYRQTRVTKGPVYTPTLSKVEEGLTPEKEDEERIPLLYNVGSTPPTKPNGS